MVSCSATWPLNCIVLLLAGVVSCTVRNHSGVHEMEDNNLKWFFNYLVLIKWIGCRRTLGPHWKNKCQNLSTQLAQTCSVVMWWIASLQHFHSVHLTQLLKWSGLDAWMCCWCCWCCRGWARLFVCISLCLNWNEFVCNLQVLADTAGRMPASPSTDLLTQNLYTFSSSLSQYLCFAHFSGVKLSPSECDN